MIKQIVEDMRYGSTPISIRRGKVAAELLVCTEDSTKRPTQCGTTAEIGRSLSLISRTIITQGLAVTALQAIGKVKLISGFVGIWLIRGMVYSTGLR